ncbi:MAG: AmmeMemoRadiSam system protein A [Acidobacteria bacterium]|nr:AmmeMemoRadiSam system protein A [Acidobacteriota bacterium]
MGIEVIARTDQQRLLVLARRALEARVRREAPPPAPSGESFDRPCGAFVTIHCHGELRGCLGRVEPSEPLGAIVVHLAGSVADSDPRFEPVSALELDEVDIEISVLTPEREIASIDEIEIGRHGLIVEQGYRHGLLLPQVAVEQQWDREAFAAHTCRKAALPPDAWRSGARLFVFEAQVFGDTNG